jgi:hypothetical protein
LLFCVSEDLGLLPKKLIPGKDAAGDQGRRQNQGHNQEYLLPSG